MLMIVIIVFYMTSVLSNPQDAITRKQHKIFNLLLQNQECPKWIKNYTRNENFCKNKKILRITPLQGFGNKLNGVLQGALGAYWLDRCLVIDWNFGALLSTYSLGAKVRNLSPFVEGKEKYKLSFPKTFKGLQKIKSLLFLDPILDMKVGYRDRFCAVVQAQQLNIGLRKQYRVKLQKNNVLCVFLEKCILQEILRPKEELKISIANIRRKWLRKGSTSIAMHVRMGDYISVKHEDQHFLKTGGDERVPKHALDLFWKTANLLAVKAFYETEKNLSSIFIATDNQFALEAANYALGSSNLYYSEGLFRHSDLDVRNDSSGLKMLTDWFLLSEADVVIQGPWSTFMEKALVYSNRKQRIFRCHVVLNKVNLGKAISHKNDWGCFENVLRDTFKGPRAIDF